MSNPHVNADRIRVTLNATLAIAAHQGVILDQDGHTVVLPEGDSLTTAVARVLYARHTRDSLGEWEYTTDPVRTWWETRADAVIDAATTASPTPLELARLIYARTALGSLDRLTSGDVAHYLITAQHIARIIAQRAQRDVEAEVKAMHTRGCRVCGHSRTLFTCILAGHYHAETGA